MERIDRRLIEKGVPIPARQLAAVAEVCWEMGENRPVPADREPLPGVYTGDDLILRAVAWYDERYGERQTVYYGAGRALVFIRGDVWEIEYPLVTGEVAFYAGTVPDAFAAVYTKDGYQPVSRGELEAKYPDVRHLDALNYIKRLPAALANTLRRHELEGILVVFCKHWQALQTLTFSRAYKYVELARGDLDAAVRHVMSDPPQPGLAKWSAQQAAEKLLKSLVFHAGESVQHHHDLRRHARQVEPLAEVKIDDAVLDEIACPASVRYDEAVSLREAFRATNKAIEACGELALLLRTMFLDVPEASGA